jgi:hypothetical protein
MERVLGIGGYFMRAADPAALGAWYRDCLGLDVDENGLWRPEAGPTVFATFESGTSYFGSRAQHNTRVAGNMRLRGARLENPGDVVLGAEGLTAEGGMWCREGFTAFGEMRLTGARIGGSVELTSARLSQPGGIALCLDRAAVADVDAAGLAVTGGKVTVAGAQITGRLNLREAARAWGVLQDFTVGYGYQPWRAVLWFTALLAIGSAIYAAAPPPALTPASAPHFNPVAYTLDLLLPVVNLGQKYAFNPDGLEQWVSYLLIAAGWILATTIAAGAARVLTRR